MDRRGRLTITDLIFVLVGLTALAAFYPVYSELLGETGGALGPGEEMLFGTVLPVAVIVLLAVVYVEARRG